MQMTSAFAIVYIVTVSACISAVDIQRLTIPDWLNIALALGGLLASLYLAPVDLQASVAGALAGGFGSWLFKILYLQLRRIDAIGLGDVKFLAAAGAWVGPLGVAPLLFIAASSALTLAGLSHLFGKGIAPTERIPFAPFLCLGLLSVAAPQLITQSSIVDLILSGDWHNYGPAIADG
jgi:leader peptidase (prepilin peptidase)/N-methyltransferase